jgi:homoserine dehydrogenase
MEPERSLTTTGSALRVGVLLAGVGGVGRAFVRVLQERFCTVEVQVRVVAVGDSKGFVAAPPSATEQHHGFAWNDVAAILDHKKCGHAVASWRSTAPLSTGLVFDELVGALQHFHAQRDLDDYVVVDCTSSTAIAPALITARELGFAVVMANKLPVAGPFDQYKQLIHGAKGRVRYEATVGAGLPVVSVVQRIMASRDSVTMIQGGLSGTMTCVLSEMNRYETPGSLLCALATLSMCSRYARGASFSAALTQAHELGITENDPREDLSVCVDNTTMQLFVYQEKAHTLWIVDNI